MALHSTAVFGTRQIILNISCPVFRIWHNISPDILNKGVYGILFTLTQNAYLYTPVFLYALYIPVFVHIPHCFLQSALAYKNFYFPYSAMFYAEYLISNQQSKIELQKKKSWNISYEKKKKKNVFLGNKCKIKDHFHHTISRMDSSKMYINIMLLRSGQLELLQFATTRYWTETLTVEKNQKLSGWTITKLFLFASASNVWLRARHF